MESQVSLSLQERFKKAFERLDLPQTVIADILIVSQKTVSNYLTGKTEPPMDVLERLESFDETEKIGPQRVRQIENLLWKIGSENPQAREIIQEMLQMNEKMRTLFKSGDPSK